MGLSNTMTLSFLPRRGSPVWKRRFTESTCICWPKHFVTHIKLANIIHIQIFHSSRTLSLNEKMWIVKLCFDLVFPRRTESGHFLNATLLNIFTKPFASMRRRGGGCARARSPVSWIQLKVHVLHTFVWKKPSLRSDYTRIDIKPSIMTILCLRYPN